MLGVGGGGGVRGRARKEGLEATAEAGLGDEYQESEHSHSA